MMNNYGKISTLNTTNLQVIRRGFWKPVYVLTDGQFEYGQLSCGDSWGRQKNIDTAEGSWVIKQIGFLGKETQIIDVSRAEVIGTVTNKSNWATKNILELNNGFKATMIKGPGFFSREMNWTTEEQVNVIAFTGTYKYKTPFNIQVDENAISSNNLLALIALIGVNLILVRQAQAAAIA